MRTRIVDPWSLVPMTERKSYPEEMFEQRLIRYRSSKRTKLPHQVEIEICERVNRLQKKGDQKATIPSGTTSEVEP